MNKPVHHEGAFGFTAGHHIVDLSSSDHIYIHRDGFGRVYFDVCPDDAAHFAAPTDPEANKRTCRVYVEEMFDKLVGKRVKFSIVVSAVEEGTPPTVLDALATSMEHRE